MFVNGSKRNEQSIQRTFHRCFLPSFISFGQAASEEKLFQKSTNKKQELPRTANCLLTDQNGMRNSHRGPSIDHRCFIPRFGIFGQVVSEQKIFRNLPIRNKICLWWPCLLMDRDKISILYREPFIDASYQVSVHLAKQFLRRRFLKITQSETRIACGGHVWKWIITKCALFREDLPQMLPTKFQFIWLRVFKGED